MAVSEPKPVRRSTGGAVSGPIESTPGSGGALCLAVLIGYLLVTAGVSAALRVPGILPHGNQTTWDRAVFTSINAATLTGFQQTMGVREMSAAGAGGPVLLFSLTILGSLVSLFIGGTAGAHVLQMPHAPHRIALAAIAAELIALIAGASALIGPDNPLFPSLFQAASAFGNSGLWIGNLPSLSALSSYAVLLPLALFGGLGLPVLIELSNVIFGQGTLSRHSRVVLTLTALIYLAGFFALLLAQVPAALGGGWPAWRSTLASCTIASLNARTAGIPFQSPAAFTPAGQWLLMALMLIGAAPAGTAAGLKITTLWQFTIGTRDILASRPAHRAAGIAAVWFLLYGFTLFLGILLLVSSESQLPGERLLFLAISALSNVGLSHDPVSITGPGLLALSGLMLAGRVAPLAVLWWMARTTQGAQVLIA